MFADTLPGRSSSPRWRATTQLSWTAWVLFLAMVVTGLLASRRQGVYPIFSHAGHCWLQGDGLYRQSSERDQFLYAPIVAAFFAPLSLVPDRLAGILWRMGGLVLFALALARYLGVLGLACRPFATSTLWLLMLPLLGASVHNGQTNLLVLGLLLIGLAAALEGRWWLAALCFGIPGLVKIYPLFLALLVGLRHPHTLFPRLAVVLLSGLLAPFALQWPGFVWNAYGDWFHALSLQDRSFWTLERAPRDLMLLTRLVGSPLPVPLYRIVQLGLTLLIVWLCLRVFRQQGDEAWKLHCCFTLACCWMLTLGPAAESSTFCFLAPSLALCLLPNLQETGGSPRLLWSLYALLAFSAAACWFPDGKHVAGVLQPLAGLAFLANRLGWAFGCSSSVSRNDPEPFDTPIVLAREERPCETASS